MTIWERNYMVLYSGRLLTVLTGSDSGVGDGATSLSIMIFSIRTFSITTLRLMTLSITIKKLHSS